MKSTEAGKLWTIHSQYQRLQTDIMTTGDTQTLHRVKIPSSLVILYRALNTLVYPRRSAGGNLNSITFITQI